MSDSKKHDTSRTEHRESLPAWLDLVRGQVASLNFGTVLITIHDSRIVQVEKNEKLRLDSHGTSTAEIGTEAQRSAPGTHRSNNT